MTVSELTRTRLRFADAATERDYLAWQTHNAVPYARFGMIASIINWIAIVIGIYAAVPDRALPAILWCLGVMVPACLVAVVLTRQARHHKWIAPLTIAINTATGCSCVTMGFHLVDIPGSGVLASAIVGFYAFTIFRLRPVQAIASALPYLVLCQVEILRTGDAPATLIIYSVGAWVAFISGINACVVLERIAREGFRQERIVEAQRLTIERERARADVAERSRELTEALSRLTLGEGPAPRFEAGHVVENRYKVVRRLGAGGMGEVHEVTRTADGRRLALKVLKGTNNREALLRFAREAEIAARIDHPNVVSVLDVGVAPEGMFLVMELIDGGTLAAERARFGNVTWALATLRDIARALSAMHELGIVHRDLKPANILIDAGKPKVADFGVARLAERDPTPVVADELTRTGMLLGTPLYMAPELIQGARDATFSADIWSLGVIAHELLSTKVPFSEPPLVARWAGRIPSLPAPLVAPGVSTDVVTALSACLALRPDDRPSAAALSRALD